MTRTTTRKEISVCTACKKPIMADVTLELQSDVDIDSLTDSDATVTVTAKVVGIRIAHDCIPKVTRSHDR